MAGASLSLREAAAPAVRPVEALTRLLDGLAAVMLEIPPDVYIARPLAEVSGSIGAHVRHTLDHIAAFAGATSSAPLSYDHRERGSAIESDPACALRAIFRLKTALAGFSDERLHDPIDVVAQLTPEGQTMRAWSSRARELAFVQSHTIHHHAIIGLLLFIQGYPPPAAFGYAPSTPRP